MTFSVVVAAVVNVADDALEGLAVVVLAIVIHDLTSFPDREMTNVSCSCPVLFYPMR